MHKVYAPPAGSLRCRTFEPSGRGYGANRTPKGLGYLCFSMHPAEQFDGIDL